MLGGQVCRRRWQPLPRPGLLVSRPGAGLWVGAEVSMLALPLVLLIEAPLALAALAASSAAPVCCVLIFFFISVGVTSVGVQDRLMYFIKAIGAFSPVLVRG